MQMVFLVILTLNVIHKLNLMSKFWILERKEQVSNYLQKMFKEIEIVIIIINKEIVN